MFFDAKRFTNFSNPTLCITLYSTINQMVILIFLYRHDSTPQVQFLLMRLTQSVVSEVQTVSMKQADELNLSF